MDHDHTVSDEIRFVQLTPPGSACSVALGTGLTTMAPGSLHMVVDVQPWGSFVDFSDPDGNGWAPQELPSWAAGAGGSGGAAGGCRVAPGAPLPSSAEDSPSGLGRTLGKRVGGNPSGVRIPHPPPV